MTHKRYMHTVDGGDGSDTEIEEYATDRATRVDAAVPEKGQPAGQPRSACSHVSCRLRNELSALPEAQVRSAVPLRGHLRGQLPLRTCLDMHLNSSKSYCHYHHVE